MKIVAMTTYPIPRTTHTTMRAITAGESPLDELEEVSLSPRKLLEGISALPARFCLLVGVVVGAVEVDILTEGGLGVGVVLGAGGAEKSEGRALAELRGCCCLVG
jgi:hypothetical protein